MTREIRAVRTALEGLEEAHTVDEPHDAPQPGSSNGVEAQAMEPLQGVKTHTDELQQDSEKETPVDGSDKLQKAGLLQRLRDLKAKRAQWKVVSNLDPA